MTERPKQKVVVADVDLTPDSISTEVIRRENGIDQCIMVANNDQGKQYLGNMTLDDVITVKYAYEEDNPNWDNLKPVFRGMIQELYPSMTVSGEIVKVIAYGQGFWMQNMNTVDTYGTQVVGSEITKPQAIIRDIINNYVNKILGLGTSSYWPSINTDYVYEPKKYLGDDITLPFLMFPYTKSMMALQEVIKLTLSAIYADAMDNSYPDWVGLHWMIDVDANLLVAPIGNHDVYGAPLYPQYRIEDKWPTRPLLSPLVVRQDMITQQFKQAIFNANYIIAAGKSVFPLNQSWTEGHAADWIGWQKHVPPNGAWVLDSHVFGTDDDGSGDTPRLQLPGNVYSLKITNSGSWDPFVGPECCLVHPFTVDLTVSSSRNNPTKLGFWVAKGGGVKYGTLEARFCKGKTIDNQRVPDLDNFYYVPITIGGGDNQWVWVEYEIGPMSREWTIVGSLDWRDIEYFGIHWVNELAHDPVNVWIDYLETSVPVLRAVYDTIHIAQRGCKIMLLKDTTAKTDTLDPQDKNNPLTQLCLYELSRQRIDIVTGSILIPLNPDLMAGQIVSLITDFNPAVTDYRITQVRHSYSVAGAFTELSLTDDVYNSISMANQSDVYGQVLKAVDPNNYLNKTWSSMFAASDISVDMELIGVDFPMPMLTIGYAANGYTDPAYGKYRKIKDSTAQIEALPNSGFVLNYWIKDGQAAGSNNPISFTMDKSHTITPLFKVQGP